MISLFGRNAPSSAAQLKAQLARNGDQPADIQFHHVKHVYESMGRYPDAPDFSLPNDIFADAANPGIDQTTPLLGAIIETRKHPALAPVVLNFVRNLGIPIQLFHGSANREYILSSPLSDLMRSGDLFLTPMRIDRLEATRYNALVLTKAFWEHLASRNKILFFQTDGISCKDSEYTIQDFMGFDYIGSKWLRRRAIGLILDGGNGGVSLRDWRKCYQCLDRFPSDRWQGGEDGYFAFHVELIGGTVGNDSSCAKFCSQREFTHKSLFGHKISCLKRRDREAFLTYCDDAKLIL